MLLLDTAINYPAVLVASTAMMAVGFLWYSPILFAKSWMKLSGITDKKIADAKKKGMGKSYAIMAVGAVVSSFVLAHFVNFAAAYTPLDGALVGFWLWLGTIAPASTSMVLFEGKPWKLYLLKVGHVLTGMMVAGAILAVWV
ncbi:DUF1761 domain-containing protein [Candidatus Gottesmanbacteria bacterium]|nr:DUF1761 domain-containing protein [Candidatus Gottesmanbacteria bacterium]